MNSALLKDGQKVETAEFIYCESQSFMMMKGSNIVNLTCEQLLIQIF